MKLAGRKIMGLVMCNCFRGLDVTRRPFPEAAQRQLTGDTCDARYKDQNQQRASKERLRTSDPTATVTCRFGPKLMYSEKDMLREGTSQIVMMLLEVCSDIEARELFV
jgi:hypothetical protein